MYEFLPMRPMSTRKRNSIMTVKVAPSQFLQSEQG